MTIFLLMKLISLLSPNFNKMAVDLVFTRFLRQGITAQSTPVFILHGIFGSKMNWRSLGKKLMMETNRPVRNNSLKSRLSSTCKLT